MPEATRARILEAALRMFVRQGFQTSTIRELAAEVDLTSAALYYHFPSKEACLEALVMPYLSEVEQVLERHPVVAEQSREERRALLSEYLEVLLQNHDLTRLVDRDPAIRTHAEIHAWISQLIEGMLTRLAGPHPTPEQRLRATAALGAVRRPVLQSDLNVAPMAGTLVDAALCAFEA